jgi:hypothetical protein
MVSISAWASPALLIVSEIFFFYIYRDNFLMSGHIFMDPLTKRGYSLLLDDGTFARQITFAIIGSSILMGMVLCIGAVSRSSITIPTRLQPSTFYLFALLHEVLLSLNGNYHI